MTVSTVTKADSNKGDRHIGELKMKLNSLFIYNCNKSLDIKSDACEA